MNERFLAVLLLVGACGGGGSATDPPDGGTIDAPSGGTIDATGDATSSADANPTLGTLGVTFAVPLRGVAGSVSIVGPAGFSQTTTTATLYSNIAPGSYTLTAGAVPVDLGTLNGAPATQTVTVTAGAQTDVTVTYVFDCPTVVTFADSIVEDRVQAALGLSTSAPVTCAQLATLTDLDVGNECCDPLPPTSLSGLEHALNLERLLADFTQIVDLGPIAALKLTELNLTKSQSVASIAPLATLTTLRKLELGNQDDLADLTPIGGLPLLEELYVNNNQLDDLTTLSNLPALRWLDIGTNPMSSLSGIEAAPNLETLSASYAYGVADLTPLTGLTKLNTVYLYFTVVTDLAPLVANAGIGTGDIIDVRFACLDLSSPATPASVAVAALQARGVTVVGTDMQRTCP